MTLKPETLPADFIDGGLPTETASLVEAYQRASKADATVRAYRATQQRSRPGAAATRLPVAAGELRGRGGLPSGGVNHILRGWSAYFSYGALASAYEAVDQHVYDRTRHFLRQRHGVQGRGTDRFSRERI